MGGNMSRPERALRMVITEPRSRDALQSPSARVDSLAFDSGAPQCHWRVAAHFK